MKNILIVDDDPFILESVGEILIENRYKVYKSSNGEEMFKVLEKNSIDLILLDVKLPDRTGIEYLPELKHFYPDISIIIITGNAEINDAVKAIKMGAYDYLKKPFKGKELLLSIEKALKWNELLFRNENLQEQVEKDFSFQGIIGKSSKMKELVKMIKQVSKTDSNILITGESGTGKELVAKAIHFSGKRKNNPFVPINCASLPETLLESELFGYVKGAFTGAYNNKNGLFKVADSGTIFLDEIGDMPLSLQAKILRVIESGEFTPLGSTVVLKTDVRIISATNINLRDRIVENRFREDLYYRLNVVNINIPPLRERREDILLIAQHFLEKYSIKMNKKIKGFSEGVKEIFLRYDWPGNVRELENAVESSCALTTDEIIDVKNLPSHLFGNIMRSNRNEFIPINRPLKETIDYYEREYLVQLLKFCNGNVTKAAQIAQIARQNLHSKLKIYNINVKDFRK
ncbi:MAG: DNA-binding response regulator HsfA [candidate division TA06 bacterium 32_111]|nr:MAG: DNA-binding response regulator HsfA [candidate division TA06 bacterium 32_111]KUK88085.1 MAG: DNA-binding response regulator HsfA [candidate division TA06 bacterium 34_109]